MRNEQIPRRLGQWMQLGPCSFFDRKKWQGVLQGIDVLILVGGSGYESARAVRREDHYCKNYRGVGFPN